MAIIRIEATGGKVYGAEGIYTPWYPEGTHSYMHSGGPLKAEGHCTISYSHVGLCLSDREYNGYDDSDWYMLVWDADKQCAHEILFATTRGWTYPAYGSKPDAGPEVRAAYDAWRARKAAEAKARMRAEKAAALRAQRADDTALAALVGCTRTRIKALRAAMGEQFAACITLLKTKNFRSGFRKSCADQVRAWLLDPAPKYDTPLSYKQRQYI